jgi:hypothetical protein
MKGALGTRVSAFCLGVFMAVRMLPTHDKRFCDMSEPVRASATTSAVTGFNPYLGS